MFDRPGCCASTFLKMSSSNGTYMPSHFLNVLQDCLPSLPSQIFKAFTAKCIRIIQVQRKSVSANFGISSSLRQRQTSSFPSRRMVITAEPELTEQRSLALYSVIVSEAREPRILHPFSI